MGRLILVTGGNSSGKTRFALSKAKVSPKLYIATGKITDSEMYEKVMRHKFERKGWDVWVSPIPTPFEFENLLKIKDYKVAILDCVGFFLSNLIFERKNYLSLIDFVEFMKREVPLSIVVSNEVSMSLVPLHPLGREFVYKLGELNKLIAEISDEFYLLISGQVLRLK